MCPMTETVVNVSGILSSKPSVFVLLVGSTLRQLPGLHADKQTAAQQRSTAVSQHSETQISKYQKNTEEWVFSFERIQQPEASLWFPE